MTMAASEVRVVLPGIWDALLIEYLAGGSGEPLRLRTRRAARGEELDAF